MTLDWSRAAVLSVTEFEVSWELLRLGETPWQLEPPPSGATFEERRRIVDTAIADMQRRGLADGRGLRPEIAARMRLLSRPAWSADIRFRSETLVAGVAAVRGPHGVLAVRRGQEIALLDVPPDRATNVLLDLVGPVAPGRGPEIHLPMGTLDAARKVGDAHFGAELVWLGLSRAEADMLVGLCVDVDLRGQLGASAELGDGTRVRRAPHVVGFPRGRSGLVRQVRHRTPGGDTLMVGPTSRDALVADLDELVGGIRR